MDLVPFIFHEKQEGLLCAQHCLNALLQGPYFNAVDLAELSKQLDSDEMKKLSTSERKKFESSNYDDSGFFSIQVISKALKIWNLELLSIKAKECAEAREKPENQIAFVCNLKQHWFTLRKFGNSKYRWYNLNSTLSGPQYVSETYLSLLIHEYQDRGYHVFAVFGEIPPCEADEYAKLSPKVPSGVPLKNPSTSHTTTTNKNQSSSNLKNSGVIDVDDEYSMSNDLQKALQMSLDEHDEGEDNLLQKAINESLKSVDQIDVSFPASSSSVRKRYVEDMIRPGVTTTPNARRNTLANAEKTSSLSVEEMRKKRLEKLENKPIT